MALPGAIWYAWWAAQNGGTNIFAPNRQDSPLSEEQLNMARNGLNAIKNAGDPSQYYQSPYSGYLADCCFPRFQTIYEKALGGATYNEITKDIVGFLKENEQFTEKNNIDTSKSVTPLAPEDAANPADRAMFWTIRFCGSL